MLMVPTYRACLQFHFVLQCFVIHDVNNSSEKHRLAVPAFNGLIMGSLLQSIFEYLRIFIR